MKRFLLPLVFLCAAVAGTPLLASAPLPADVADTLAYMREEEKLARDVYLYFAELFPGQKPGSNIFARIAKSEQRHMDAVKKLLDKYGLPDPAAGKGQGDFANEALQSLYDALVTFDDAEIDDYVEGLLAGVAIEVKDIADITAAIKQIADSGGGYPDIVRVYANLLAGSESHLAAFRKILGKLEDVDRDLDAVDAEARGTTNGTSARSGASSASSTAVRAKRAGQRR